MNVTFVSHHFVSRLWRFKLHRKWRKGCPISSCCFLGNNTKKWFLTNWGRDTDTQGVHEHSKFWKKFTIRWVKIYVQQTSTRLWKVRVNKWFKKRFCGTYPFYKTYETSKMYWNISLLHDQAQEQEIRFLLITFFYKSHFKKEKYRTT